ncbi:MAG: sodium:proton antiporter, partial [Myxococcota bacterium]
MTRVIPLIATLLAPALAHAMESGDQPLGTIIPIWSVVPFGVMLLAIAVLPMLVPTWWHHNKNRALVALVLGLPMATWMAVLDYQAVLHTLHEYAAFIILLGALFVISGGIVIRGTLSGTPGVNTILLLIGG